MLIRHTGPYTRTGYQNRIDLNGGVWYFVIAEGRGKLLLSSAPETDSSDYCCWEGRYSILSEGLQGFAFM
jgi:hypothetical protein